MTEPGYFEHLYRTDPDPWGLADAPYEHRKRAVTMASLPRARYSRAFEPACAGGHLTALLAERCDRVLAVDLVPTAVERTAARGLANVDVTRGSLPTDWPDGSLDLVVLAEVLYFLTPRDRAEVARRTVDSLAPDGHVLAVHWRHDFAESASTPEEAHGDLHDHGLAVVVSHLEDDFRLEVLRRA